MMTDPNPIAGPGHNNPPTDPFDAIDAHIRDLYAEAKHFLDGEPIASEAMAAAVEDLLAQIREAEKLAEAQRKAEKDPLDEQVAAIQAKWNPLIGSNKSVKGMTVLASEACRAALAPWRRAQEAAKLAAAEKARQEAQAAADAAAKAMRAAQVDDLAAREDAERLVREADHAAKLASRADKAATTGTGLRSTWIAKMVNPVDAARWAWKHHRSECEAFFQSLADADVRSGKRALSGFEIEESRRAI
jgi:hypothetical protein